MFIFYEEKAGERETVMKWKSLFKSHILERGYEYYLNKKVEIKSNSDNVIVAEVDGSTFYDVVINYSGDKIEHMECDCPFAESGKYCKHMAAVLYKFFEDDEKDSDDEDEFDDELEYYPNGIMNADYDAQKNSDEVDSLLDIIPEEEKRAILIRLLGNNAELRNTIKLKYDFQLDAKQMLALKNEIRDIVSMHSYRGFIDWQNAYDFCCDLRGFLEDKVEILIGKGAILQAFELNNQVFKLIGTIDMDDSDGGSGIVAEKCYELWKEIYQRADSDEKTKIKKWFNSYKKGTVIDWIEEYLLEFMKMELATKEQIKKQLKEFDQMLDEKKNSTDCGYVYSALDGRVSVIEKRIECMKKLGMTEEEIDDFCKQNRNFHVVRKMEIDKALSDNDYETAIKILEESKILDKSNESLIKSYSGKLIELYKKTNKNKKYKEELKYNLLNFWQQDTDNYKGLKELMADDPEWTKLIDKIIEKNGGYETTFAIMFAEERYEQMMDSLDKSRNIFIMDKYAKKMSKKLPDRVIQFYSDYLIREMERANDRKSYRNLVMHFKMMEYCPSGNESAKKIAEKWKTEYRRRSALMDELQRAGY